MSDNQVGDTAPAVPSTDTLTPSQKRRGRPAGRTSGIKPEHKAETPRQRLDQLKAEMAKAEEALREFEAKRDSIVGAVVTRHALANADYRKQLAALLRKEVTSKGELAFIAELLE